MYDYIFVNSSPISFFLLQKQYQKLDTQNATKKTLSIDTYIASYKMHLHLAS